MNQGYDFLFRILICGDKKVGKTCISNQFVSGTFSEKYHYLYPKIKSFNWCQFYNQNAAHRRKDNITANLGYFCLQF